MQDETRRYRAAKRKFIAKKCSGFRKNSALPPDLQTPGNRCVETPRKQQLETLRKQEDAHPVSNGGPLLDALSID